jgi:hypothetical protein
MKKEGFNYAPNEYRTILSAMASVGFGSAKANQRGEVEALVGVTTQIKDIGKLVVEGSGQLGKFATRHKYSPIPQMPKPLQVIALPKKEALKPPASQAEKKEVVKALGGVEELLRSILGNESIPSERRIAAAQALLQT